MRYFMIHIQCTIAYTALYIDHYSLRPNSLWMQPRLPTSPTDAEAGGPPGEFALAHLRLPKVARAAPAREAEIEL
jgi:hypothetical protein